MNISFSLTIPQVLARTKDITRRMGKREYHPGQILQAVEKARGLKRGEHVVVIGKIRVISARREWLNEIIYGGEGEREVIREVIREGFPDMTPCEFVKFFCRTHPGCKPWTIVQRIEFEYLDEVGEEKGSKKP